MCVPGSRDPLSERLHNHPLRQHLISHPLFSIMRSGSVSKGWVGEVLAQWWHPLHNFPVFLGRCIAVLPDIESQSSVARILFQETGQGKPDQAHEIIFSDTMETAGYDRSMITDTPPSDATRALLADYETAQEDRYSALGCLAATEFADLAMVAGIGSAVRRASGVTDLPWVDIHVEQEPDHVEDAGHALLSDFDAKAGDLIVQAAERSWHAWIDFFDYLSALHDAAPAAGVEVEAVP